MSAESMNFHIFFQMFPYRTAGFLRFISIIEYFKEAKTILNKNYSLPKKLAAEKVNMNANNNNNSAFKMPDLRTRKEGSIK